MQLDSITVGDLDALVLACDESVHRLARKYGSYGVVESDDLYSVGMIEICEAVAAGRLASVQEPVSYLCAVAKYAIIDELNRVRGHSMVSLEAPLVEGEKVCRLDRVPAPGVAPAGESEVAGVVRDALSRLTRRQREVLQAFYGVEGCGCGGTQKQIGRALGISRSCAGFHAARGRQALRRDVELCSALGVEVER